MSSAKYPIGWVHNSNFLSTILDSSLTSTIVL
nr:MAG TPA: hypothetical protein [Caudoviricetes sp.]